MQNPRDEGRLIKTACEAAPLLLFAINKEGKLLAVSGGELARLRISTSETLGKYYHKVKNLPINRSLFRKAMQGEKFSATIPVGAEIYETFLSPERDVNSDIIGCTGFSLNITERLGIEESLDRERYKAVRAQQLNSLTNMANGIAHEINNPLAIISGYAEQMQELVKENLLTNERATFICGKLITTSMRMAQLINCLQSLSQDGVNDLIEIVSFKSIFSSAWDVLNGRFSTAGIKVDIPEIDDGITIECRRVQIMQALFNLLINSYEAVKDKANPWVKIEVVSQNSFLTVTITDSGDAVPANMAYKIFEPFFTTKKFSHPGLGLSTTRELLKSHNGELRLSPCVFHTSFVISLPLKQPKSAA